MSHFFYNRNHIFCRLFWFFWNYFQNGATLPTAANLYLLTISMLAMESFRSAWRHMISRITDKSLNSFYDTLEHAVFDHHKWAPVTARFALSCVPSFLKGSAVFLSIDDTMVEKYGTSRRIRRSVLTILLGHAAPGPVCAKAKRG